MFFQNLNLLKPTLLCEFWILEISLPKLFNLQPFISMDAPNSGAFALARASLNLATKVTGNSLYNPPMPTPINNKKDLEAFMKVHHDVLVGCHLELERHCIDIGSKLPLIIRSNQVECLHSSVVIKFGA